ncbi:MAG TPA: gliding motility-associated protein GldE [Flavobacteriaceae bacterium]|nr:gliding motility-associated protein GldE [Flavobacteriaceae bacterium]
MDPEPPSLFLFLLIDFSQLLGVTSLVFLLICSALISGAEVALFSLNPIDFESDPVKRTRKEVIIIQLLDRPKKLLATILVSNNAINIAIVLLFESLSTRWFSSLYKTIDLHLFTLDLVFFLKVGVATFMILLFGEILPKIYASRNRAQFSFFMAYPLKMLDAILTPITMPMRSLTIYIQQKFGRQKANISVDQLSHALELTNEEDTTQEEQKILKGIVSFGNTDTREVMKPRMDIFALREDLSFEEVITKIVEQGYSRIPVYKDNMDQVTGILYVKDLIPYLDKKTFDWKKLLREPYFIPENKKLDDLLNDFKEKKMHLAIVVDEYGGTCGLISLEDIIEEIVGDISDEFDDESLIFSKLDDKNYVFEGKTPLKDFYKIIKIEDPSAFEEVKGEAESLAGIVLEISKKILKRGDVIRFENFSFTIEATDNKRIKQIKVSID